MMRMKQPSRQVFRRSLLRTLSLLLAVPLLCAFALTGLGVDSKAEDPTIGVSKIIWVQNSLSPKKVNIGTPENEIGLPSTLSCIFGDGRRGFVPVSWNCPNYNQWKEGTYSFSSSPRDNYEVDPNAKFPTGTVIVERQYRPDPPPRPPRRPASDSDATSAFADGEYDFWKAVRRRILNADSGDIIRVQARRYNKFPEIVMRALRLRTSVSLLIEWNGGDDIFIPAGEALYDDGTSLFWTLRQLEKIYGDSGQVTVPADPPKPETKPEPAPSAPTVTETKPSAGTGGFSPGADALPASTGAEALTLPVTGVTAAEPSVTNTPVVPAAPAVDAADVNERPSAISEPVRQTQAEGRSAKAIVTGGTPSVLPSEAKADELPEALVMTVALLAVLALCGVFTGAWLFSRKGQIRR